MNPLEGTWQPIKAELDGETAPAEALEPTRLTLAGGRYAVKFGGEVSDQGTYTIDEAGLALTGTDGPNAGRVIPCLFKHHGNRLRICFGLGGHRPAVFATKPGSRHYLVDYKREIRQPGTST